MRGFATSLLLHVIAAMLVLVLGVPSTRHVVKRGEPLIVELPDFREPPPRGNPAAKTAGAPARPRPPAPRPVPAPAPPAPVKSEPEREAKAEPERAVEPPPLPSPPVPETLPAPTPPPPVAEAPSVPEPPPVAETPPTVVPPPAPPVTAAPEPPPRAEPQVAAVAPAPAPIPEPPPVDIRSALGRGGGAGGRGGGRGGIEGEPIPLDSTDAKFNDYLDRLRRRIKAKWGFPCIKSEAGPCDYKTTSLIVEFGILKDGRLQFVDVVQSSGFPIYDDYAVNAIKFASPFPAVPPAMIVSMKQGSTGVAITARFNYVVDTSLTNLLR